LDKQQPSGSERTRASARREKRLARQLAPLTVACLLLTAISAFAVRGRYTLTQVKPGIFVWVPDDIYDFDGDPKFRLPGTAGFILGLDGVVVVNTTNSPFHAREVLYEIRERTELPVKFVIDTDARGDHVLGNEAFVDQRANFIASTAAAAGMLEYRRDLNERLTAEGESGYRMRERMRGIHFTLPNQTISKDLTLGVGGEEIRLLLPGVGPSPGSLVVLLPRSRVLFLGSLYENGYVPKLDGVDLDKWMDYLRQVEAWDVDVYVPAHGAPGDKKALAEFREFLEWSKNNPGVPAPKGKSLIQTQSGAWRRAAPTKQNDTASTARADE
jgi:glyoxylase-like metal-dependent hydrolase (beta-lactamase superfamily II)